MFTALAVMRLVESGRLNLDTTVRSVAPEIAFENPWESVAPVRIRHLLEHTTGWDDIHYAEYAYDNRAEAPLLQTLAFHPDSRKSRWVPGTRMSYSNSGAAVAGYVVQKISGQPFERFVADNIFLPLGMNSASYFADAGYRQHGATLYAPDGKVQPYLHILYRPDGSTNVSAADMGKLMKMFMDRGTAKGQRLFSASAITHMEGLPTALSGLGTLAMGYRGYRFTGHSGSIEGASSQFWYQPESGIGYVAMINKNDSGALAEIGRAILGSIMDEGMQPPSSAPQRLDQLWQTVDGNYIHINPRMEMARFAMPFAAIHLAYKQNGLARSYLLRRDSDLLLPGPNGSVIEPGSGLPVVKRGTDPLAGETVQIGDKTYARVSAFQIYGLAAGGCLLLLTSAASVLFALVWIPRRLLGKIPAGPATQVRAWPLAATLLLAVSVLILPVMKPQESELGLISPLTVTVMIASAAYGIAALAGLWSVLRWRSAAINRCAYWFASLHALLHSATAVYLGWHGLIGLRLWA
jgi:CubicO group peptidase (beta-lactamase class C family)